MEESVSFDVRNCSPLTLAFVGDGIFDLVIRTRVVVGGGNRPVNKLHRDKAAIVNAHSQAVMAELLRPFFTKEEETVFRRGRNAHSATTAKNQSIADYRAATGLESLCGYLYLTGKPKSSFPCETGVLVTFDSNDRSLNECVLDDEGDIILWQGN